jgi:shikimate kinase
MRAEAMAYGAITIVNAISTGRGSALGIDLWTHANVDLNDSPRMINVHIKSDPSESSELTHKVVAKVLQRFKVDDRYGADVEVDSNIPIARGLKSSSAASNAIALATVGALGKKLHDLEIVKLGVRAAIEAGVTITGAFDDACASYFGNLVVTDNRKLRIEKKYNIKKRYKILVHVPELKSYTINSNVEKMKKIAPLIRLAYQQGLRGDYWDAMCLNGYVHSTLLGYDTSIAMKALSSGAVAAGLSGKGPAVAAIVPSNKVDSVKDAWAEYAGNLLLTEINRKKAHILR